MPIMSKTDSFFIVFILIVWGIGGFPVALCAQGAAGVLPETHLVEVGKGYSQTSVNTAVFRNNSLVTQGDEHAAAIGYSTKTVGRIERGDSTPSAEFMLQISKYFNMLVEDVFHVED